MSIYQFIASEHPIPTVYSDRKRHPDGSFKDVMETRDCLGDLEIIPAPPEDPWNEAAYYTAKPHLYTLSWACTEENLRTLADYVWSCCEAGTEIWTIWLGDWFRMEEETPERLGHSSKTILRLCEMTEAQLEEALNSKHMNQLPAVLVLEE